MVNYLLRRLHRISDSLKVDNYNEHTLDWSKGYIKGYNAAIKDFENGRKNYDSTISRYKLGKSCNRHSGNHRYRMVAKNGTQKDSL